MKEFLISNWQNILIIGCFLVFVIYLIVKGRWEQLRKITYKLILQAEKSITGTKKGRERFNQVLSQLYNKIPAWIRFFVPKLTLERILQGWFDEIKDFLDDGKINGSASK